MITILIAAIVTALLAYAAVVLARFAVSPYAAIGVAALLLTMNIGWVAGVLGLVGMAAVLRFVPQFAYVLAAGWGLILGLLVFAVAAAISGSTPVAVLFAVLAGGTCLLSAARTAGPITAHGR